MERKFIADTMLGKLARWLRIIGCDVEYYPDMDDAELVERAAREGRLILTRDTLLIRRRKARGNHFFVEGDHFRDQLRQVLKAFAIDPFERFLTRCLECNEPLLGIEKAAVRERVPPYVFASRETFRTCPSCDRIYWGATHRVGMAEEIARILDVKP
ncbi:MAG: hypothetical protein FD174_2014 [Geobacteraceae bacterium]|nr:MAG: hypothetical protein FD174_2014 [Geobacteraceae bacterium]